MPEVRTRHQRRIGQEFEFGLLSTVPLEEREALQRKILEDVHFAPELIGQTVPWLIQARKMSENFTRGDISRRDAGLGLECGARLYYDSPHIELGTALARHALEALALTRASDRIMHKIYPNFVRNNYDAYGTNDRALDEGSVGVTFGSHLNLWTTRRALDDCWLLFPHLVSMQIFAGAGVVSQREKPFDKSVEYGEVASFSLSARALSMRFLIGKDTLKSRAILNLDREDHAAHDLGRRLHIISCDSLVHDIPEFLKIFSTDIVLRAIEDGWLQKHARYFRFQGDHFFSVLEGSQSSLPPIINDMHEIARVLGRWKVHSMQVPAMRSALAIQSQLLELTSAAYEAEDDQVIRLGFKLWREVLSRLSKLTGRVDSSGICRDDLTPLFGWVDWATKKYLLDQFLIGELRAGRKDVDLQSFLVSQDLEYHHLDPKRNSSGAVGPEKVVQGLLRESTVLHFERFPPRGRSVIHHLMARMGRNFSKLPPELAVDWDVVRYGEQTVALPDPNSQYPNLQRYLRQRFSL